MLYGLYGLPPHLGFTLWTRHIIPIRDRSCTQAISSSFPQTLTQVIFLYCFSFFTLLFYTLYTFLSITEVSHQGGHPPQHNPHHHHTPTPTWGSVHVWLCWQLYVPSAPVWDFVWPVLGVPCPLRPLRGFTCKCVGQFSSWRVLPCPGFAPSIYIKIFLAQKYFFIFIYFFTTFYNSFYFSIHRQYNQGFASDDRL